MTSKHQEAAMLADQNIKPPSQPTMVKIKRFLYDPDTGEFLGRTSLGWGKLFYYFK